MKDLNLIFADEISFGKAHTYDIAFFQRPSNPQELEAIRILKRLNIPVIVEYDDLLFQVPTDNPAHRSYMNPETQKVIVDICREATCIWVSTKELKRTLQLKNSSLNDRVYVIPNALDDVHLLHGAKKRPTTKRTSSVLWRGSATHERDILQYAPEIAAVAALQPKWSFVFAGYHPWFLTERMANKQALISGPLAVGEFMDFVYGVAPSVGMVPLHDSRFNRCKSNIAWLEMTWAGAVCLVPDWEEWRMPGVVSYKNAEGYRVGLGAIMTMETDERAKYNQMSWDYIENNLMLTHVNKLRERTICAALERGGNNKWPDGWQPLEDPDTAHVKQVELIK